MKIRTKLGVFLIYLAIMLIISFFITMLISKNTIEDLIEKHLLTTVQSRANLVETLLHNHQETVQLLAAGIPFTNVVDPQIDYSRRMTECNLRIKRSIENNPFISNIRVLDKNGIIIASSLYTLVV